MRNRTLVVMTLLAVASLCAPGYASQSSGYGLDVVVGGASLPRYPARGRVYVEAQRGADYSIRLTNPTGSRVAVALSVDGLNTIDAEHTDARSASKWVIDPYDSIVISGWQVSNEAARRFFFTGETDSYGAAIGQTENLGVIAAVFFREKAREVRRYDMGMREQPVPQSRGEAGAAQRDAAPPASAEAQSKALDDDYAATGMGSRQQHDVRQVELELDPHPVASIEVRYEFRPQLVKLGVLPREVRPLDRRERARGFEEFCPEPD